MSIYKNTLAKNLLEGVLTEYQVYQILDLLYQSIKLDDLSELTLSDYDDSCGFGLSAIAGDFKANKVVFDGLRAIKIKNKSLWSIHALTTPYHLEGHPIEL